MSPEGSAILEHLQAVARERQRRTADPALGERVALVKRYQHARFEKTYADLLADSRYHAAARFFLDELYGPADFSERDDQFGRIVPPLIRLFSVEIVKTVQALASLHALSESLDTAMGIALAEPRLDAGLYRRAWQAVGRRDDRELQVALMLQIGGALDHYTRSVLVRQSLRIMRAPARAAGLTPLQGFLERGFEAFRTLRGASPFLDTVAGRERALATALFSSPDDDAVLRQLP